jgi:hypothetical protein
LSSAALECASRFALRHPRKHTDVEEFLALGRKLRAVARLSLDDANRALAQLTKEELGRLELAEQLISSGAFPPDPIEESDRRAVSDALHTLRQRVVNRKSRSGG